MMQVVERSATRTRHKPGVRRADISVLVITYNHARYIEAALDSILSQNTSRQVEIIVSEDGSTDRTFETVRDYANKNDAIRIIRSESNIASNEVVARAIREAQGEYVCLLDGDDFWIDAEKLEKQAAILDENPGLSAVFHNAVVVDEGGAGTASRWTPAGQAPVSHLAQMWEGNPFATCAGMIRRTALKGLGPWYDDFFPVTDWPLYLLCAMSGPIAFYDEPVGAYRLHAEGMYSALPDARKLDRTEDFYRRMGRVFSSQRGLARAGRTRYFFDWAAAYERERNYPMALSCLWRALRAGGIGGAVSPIRFARVAARVLLR